MSNEKAKKRQSSKNAKSYEVQKFKTDRNKARRAAKLKKYLASAKCLKRKEARKARNIAKGIPRGKNGGSNVTKRAKYRIDTSKVQFGNTIKVLLQNFEINQPKEVAAG
jgi:hypothetical protein